MSKFAGVELDVAEGWVDITETLDQGSPPTLAREDGIGVLQFSTAMYRGGSNPKFDSSSLKTMLADFARSHGLPAPSNVIVFADTTTIVSGDFSSKDEFIRAWYVTNSRSLSFLTYTSMQPSNPITQKELGDANSMVRSMKVS